MLLLRSLNNRINVRLNTFNSIIKHYRLVIIICYFYTNSSLNRIYRYIRSSFFNILKFFHPFRNLRSFLKDIAIRINNITIFIYSIFSITNFKSSTFFKFSRIVITIVFIFFFSNRRLIYIFATIKIFNLTIIKISNILILFAFVIRTTTISVYILTITKIYVHN